MNKKNIRLRSVYQECEHTMRIPVLMEVCISIMTGTLGVITADTLGNFADAAFSLDFSMGLKNIAALTVFLCLSVFILPAAGMFADFVMLKKALLHDNIVFGHYLDKRIASARSQSVGKTQYELEEAPNILRIYWVRILSKAISLPFCLGYFLYYVGRINWMAAVLMLVIPSAKLAVPAFFKKRLAAYDRQDNAYQAKRRDYETDLVRMPYIAKMWGIENSFKNRIDRLFDEYFRCNASSKIICEVCAEQMQTLIGQAAMVFLLFIGAAMTARGIVTPGEFASLFLYLSVSQTFFQDIGEILQSYPLLMNAADRICKFYQDEEDTSGKLIPDFFDISGTNLSFSYSDRIIFENLNFYITAGEKVRICGENGNGKSTLLKILSSSLENYKGTLIISGADSHSVSKKSWRNLIAYAPQIPYLFSETVRDNITLRNPEKNEAADRLMDAFGILPLASRIPGTSSDFSGGEKQKISLARTLLKDSEVLILDEPSNHLDLESIQVLKNHLRKTKKTVILVSHDEYLAEITEREIWINRC